MQLSLSCHLLANKRSTRWAGVCTPPQPVKQNTSASPSGLPPMLHHHSKWCLHCKFRWPSIGQHNARAGRGMQTLSVTQDTRPSLGPTPCIQSCSYSRRHPHSLACHLLANVALRWAGLCSPNPRPAPADPPSFMMAPAQ